MNEMPSNMPTGQEQKEESAEQIIEELKKDLRELKNLKDAEQGIGESHVDHEKMEKLRRSIVERFPLRRILSANPELVDKVEILTVGGENLEEKSLLVAKNFPDIAFLFNSNMAAVRGPEDRQTHSLGVNDEYQYRPGLMTREGFGGIAAYFDAPGFYEDMYTQQKLFGKRSPHDDGAWDDKTWMKEKQKAFIKNIQEVCRLKGIKNLVVSLPEEWIDTIEGVRVFALDYHQDGMTQKKAQEHDKRWGVQPAQSSGISQYDNDDIEKAIREITKCVSFQGN